jgi:hypothetical protein
MNNADLGSFQLTGQKELKSLPDHLLQAPSHAEINDGYP